MKRVSLMIAAAAALAAHAAEASEDGQAIAHAVQSATLSSAAIERPESPGANTVAGSISTSTRPLNLLQNSGDAVVQNAQNILAASAPCRCTGPAVAEATGVQLARVSNRVARIERTGGSNTIRDSVAGSSSMINVMQNTGSNVVQNAENVVALVVRRP